MSEDIAKEESEQHPEDTGEDITETDGIIKHIVISGGGVTGFSFYGFLRDTHRNGLWKLENIKTIYGTSIGAYIAVVLALGYEWEILDTYFIKRPWQNLFKFDLYSILNVFDKKGIFDIKIFEEMIGPLFAGMEIPPDITMKQFYEKTGIEIHMFSTELNSMKPVDFSYKTHPDWKVVQCVFCSSALPIVFEPFIEEILVPHNPTSLDVDAFTEEHQPLESKLSDSVISNVDTCTEQTSKQKKCYVDGGFFINYPLDHCLRDTGAKLDEILAINKLQNTSDIPIGTDSTFFDYLLIAFNRLFEIVLNQYQGTETTKITH